MIIKLNDMIQINVKNKFTRRVRLCIEFPDKNGFYLYEHENDKKKWIIYNAEIMIQIANAIENEQTIISVNYQNQSYDIDLENLTETNLDTKIVQKIRSIKSSSENYFL
jgi:hypothetical protein